jgi:hypothetical protein
MHEKDILSISNMQALAINEEIERISFSLHFDILSFIIFPILIRLAHEIFQPLTSARTYVAMRWNSQKK